MTHSRTPWPSFVLSVLLASLILGALAWCGRPLPPKPVETTPTVVVIPVSPAPTLQTVIAGPPHARYTPTPAWTPDPVLTTPTSTPTSEPTHAPTQVLAPSPTPTPRPPIQKG